MLGKSVMILQSRCASACLTTDGAAFISRLLSSRGNNAASNEPAGMFPADLVSANHSLMNYSAHAGRALLVLRPLLLADAVRALLDRPLRLAASARPLFVSREEAVGWIHEA